MKFQIKFFSIIKRIAITSLLFSVYNACAWEVKGNSIQTVSDFPYGIYGYRSGGIAFDFKKMYKCEPVISIFMLNGGRLGKFNFSVTKFEVVDQNTIEYDNFRYSFNHNAVNFYSDGVEYASLVKFYVIEKIQNNSSVFIRVRDGQKYGFRTPSNFRDMLKRARANCA